MANKKAAEQPPEPSEQTVGQFLIYDATDNALMQTGAADEDAARVNFFASAALEDDGRELVVRELTECAEGDDNDLSDMLANYDSSGQDTPPAEPPPEGSGTSDPRDPNNPEALKAKETSKTEDGAKPSPPSPQAAKNKAFGFGKK